MTPGYFIAVDSEGVEIPGTRRNVTGLDKELERAIVRELEAQIGEGCTVVFRER